MPTPIEFFFDFASPYGYIASHRIDEIAAGHEREVAWRPYLMGAGFKITGRKPLVEHPMVNEYAYRDLKRTARLYDVPFKLPDPFPVATVAACRAYYWMLDQDTDTAKQLARDLYRTYFAKGRNIANSDEVLSVAEAGGIDRDALGAALQDPIVKQRVRDVTDNALKRNIFGSPFIIIDGEPFWGVDHLGQADRWLETGGW